MPVYSVLLGTICVCEGALSVYYVKYIIINTYLLIVKHFLHPTM